MKERYIGIHSTYSSHALLDTFEKKIIHTDRTSMSKPQLPLCVLDLILGLGHDATQNRGKHAVDNQCDHGHSQ